jgi:hypothetical protein
MRIIVFTQSVGKYDRHSAIFRPDLAAASGLRGT